MHTNKVSIKRTNLMLLLQLPASIRVFSFRSDNKCSLVSWSVVRKTGVESTLLVGRKVRRVRDPATNWRIGVATPVVNSSASRRTRSLRVRPRTLRLVHLRPRRCYFVQVTPEKGKAGAKSGGGLEKKGIGMRTENGRIATVKNFGVLQIEFPLISINLAPPTL